MDHTRRLTAFAADCADRALQFTTTMVIDDRATTAVRTARAWAAGTAGDDDCVDAAIEAQRAAGDAADTGHRSLAAAIRAAVAAAASALDPDQVKVAAELAVEAVSGTSAGCERDANVAAERRTQWEELGELAPLLFDAEPPEPPPAACAIPG